MFRVVIIDDEPVILRNIKNSIESLDEDFQIIGTATEGNTGLTVIRNLKPDLVFVDICMPVMDGLEVINVLRKEGNMVPTVILSGYQEFDYAKKAIILEVLDYLVKPLNPLSLKKFLEQLKEKLLINQYDKRRQFLEGVFHYNSSLQEMVMNLFGPDEKFLLTKICFGSFNFVRNNQFSPAYSAHNLQLMKELCEEKWGKAYWILEGKFDNEILLINIYKQKSDKIKVQELFEQTQNQVSPKYYVTFVTSDKSKNVLELRGELTELESQLYYKSIYGRSVYLIKNSMEQLSTQNNEIKVDYAYIGMLALKKKKTELLNALKEILTKCKNVNCTQANLINILKNLMRSCCPKEAGDEIDFMMNLVVVNAQDYEALYMKFCETVLAYTDMEDNNSIGDAGAEYMVYRVQDYLDSHYQEKVLIQEVADKFGFNYSYLCHLFRKHKNVSPNEYIIMKRIELAKKLLNLQPDLSIKEVAGMAGYTDQYYFSRIFKTYTGVSPTEYRERKD